MRNTQALILTSLLTCFLICQIAIAAEPAAVSGESVTDNGVLGLTESNEGASGSYGVIGLQQGNSTADLPSSFWKAGGFFAGDNGVTGVTTTNGGYAVLGFDDSDLGGYAGRFRSESGGGVWISTPPGNTGLTVVGGSKNAVVPTSKGERLLYVEESTEVWFTDYGFGQLQGGATRIVFDEVFAETVNLDQPYHVFVQAYGDSDLYVTNRSPVGFDVRSRSGAMDSEFSYRVVAKRVGFEGHRLEPAPGNPLSRSRGAGVPQEMNE